MILFTQPEHIIYELAEMASHDGTKNHVLDTFIRVSGAVGGPLCMTMMYMSRLWIGGSR